MAILFGSKNGEKNVYWASGCKSNKENKNTVSSPRKSRHKCKKQKQTFVEELSEDSQSFSLEEESEVSIDGQQSADFEFGFEKYQNTFQYKELSEIME